MTIIDHLEQYLGKIEQGWMDNKSDDDLQIVNFKNSPFEFVSTFSSLGMSNRLLDLSGNKKVRQELLFTVYLIDVPGLIVSFMMSLCEAILDRKKAVFRGEVIPLSTELAERIGFSAVYCAIPVLFDDDFCTYDKSSPSTVMVWVVPIYESEVDFINTHGWKPFEDLLEEKDPDLCCLKRNSVV